MAESDRLQEIKAAWAISNGDEDDHTGEAEDEAIDLLLENVPWLIAEVERLRAALAATNPWRMPADVSAYRCDVCGEYDEHSANCLFLAALATGETS